MKTENCFFILVLLFVTSCATVKHVGLSARKIKTESGWELPYNIFYPKIYGKVKVPVFIWLHGAGERGDDNVSQLIHVVPYLASDITQSKFPCVVVAPQCPKDGYWAPIKREKWEIINGGKVTPSMSGVITLIEKLLKDPYIDKSRIYVGGLSMGGFGTLDLISRRPELVAAGVPVCGGADLQKVANYKNVPLWIFHGAKDTVVPAQFSRDLVDALKNVGADPKYTEYPDGGHDVWNRAIREPELLQWLFSQQKN